MKKIKSIKILSIVFAFIIGINSIFAVSDLGKPFNQGNIQEGNKVLTSQTDRVAGIVITVLQVASVAGVIMAGVSYMFSSADQRADIKGKLLMLCIGLIIVFSGSTVAKFIINMFNEVTT
jgi:flagellar basal body-associated protein FliL